MYSECLACDRCMLCITFYTTSITCTLPHISTSSHTIPPHPHTLYLHACTCTCTLTHYTSTPSYTTRTFTPMHMHTLHLHNLTHYTSTPSHTTPPHHHTTLTPIPSEMKLQASSNWNSCLNVANERLRVKLDRASRSSQRA